MGNKLVGTTSVKLGIYEESDDSQLAGMLGDKKEFEDGRIFRLCKAGEALTAGTVCQGPVENASGYYEELAIATSVADGDKTITLTTQSAWTAELFANGYLVIEDATADVQGTLRKIKSHPAAGSAESCVVTVYDAFVKAATAGTDEVSMIVSPFNGVLENNGTTDGPILGVPPMTITTAYYFWLQVAGPAAVLTGEGTVLPGQMMVVDAQAGVVMMEDGAGDSEEIGRSMASCDTSGNAAIIWLTLG